MFQSLGERLGGIFDGLRGRGALSAKDVEAALREIRIALLEADVALPVVKDFINTVKEQATGEKVVRSVSPGQMVVKIVHDQLVAMLGADQVALNLQVVPPAVFLIVGLQGSGKTTTTGKLAKRLKKQGKKVLMASLDVYRPAAQEQLRVLGTQTEVATLPIVEGEKPETITKRALAQARLESFDVLLLDTAGRTHIDSVMMAEVVALHRLSQPVETLLVADAMTGQDAVQIATAFRDALPLTGVILTRLDSDARGGAALSMRALTGCPIKLAGVGEKLDALEEFHPQRIADRILGMGDIVSLVERASETVDKQEAERITAKMKKGAFDLDDLAKQLQQMRKMGGVASLMGMIPGLSKLKGQVNNQDMEKSLRRQEAIISSMTPKERRNPKLLNATRKRRVAQGAGVEVPEINRLLKQFEQMAQMMKRFGKMDEKTLKRNIGGLGLK